MIENNQDEKDEILSFEHDEMQTMHKTKEESNDTNEQSNKNNNKKEQNKANQK